MKRLTRSTLIAALSMAFVLTLAATATARSTLDDLRTATARYHSVTQAEKAGYVEFLDCFDSPAGGMGQHYVNLGALDGTVDPLAPESLVYEVVDDKLKLVGVEYIVPGGLVDPADPPELFGEHFHENTALGVWVLHAWVWKANPDGVFADFNPDVGACP
jgi:hypothetical protein